MDLVATGEKNARRHGGRGIPQEKAHNNPVKCTLSTNTVKSRGTSHLKKVCYISGKISMYCVKAVVCQLMYTLGKIEIIGITGR